MTDSKDKVYCGLCKHFKFVEMACDAPSNVKENWLSPRGLSILSPETKNKNNDCPDFEEKPKVKIPDKPDPKLIDIQTGKP